MITEGVKSALAQIAASTIHHHDEPSPRRPRRPSKPVAVRAPEEAAQEAPGAGSQAPRTEKDLLLDSVLSALPEPKAPGQGRSRRRVTTAALTGTPVAHAPSED